MDIHFVPFAARKATWARLRKRFFKETIGGKKTFLPSVKIKLPI
jgi:hypothetical protein